jgi:hypothetical protein
MLAELAGDGLAEVTVADEQEFHHLSFVVRSKNALTTRLGSTAVFTVMHKIG